MKTIATGGILGAVLIFLTGQMAPAAQLQYSANQVTTITNGGETHKTQSRIHVGNRKIREDILSLPSPSRRMIMIVRMDKKVFYQLDPVRKTALELPFKVSPSQKMMLDDSKNRFVKVGRESVDGVPCDKYEMKDKGKVVGYEWRAVDTGYPVMIRSADGKVVTRLTDFTPGPQPDSLFEVPSGYRTMNMQSFGGAMRHAMGGMMPSLP